MQALRLLAAAFCYFLCGLLTAPSQLAAKELPDWPGDAWTVATPESQGIDSRKLTAALTVLRDRGIPWHGVAIVRHGRMVFEVSNYPFPTDGLHDIASCTKTVTALGVGVAIDRGRIAGPDAKLAELFAGRSLNKLDDKKRAVRLEDLLTMRSGLFCLQDALSQMQMFQSPDYMQFCLDLPASRQPGEHFQYFSLNSHLLSGAVQQALGQPLAEAVREAIFVPIGVADFGWPADPQGTSHGWGDLRLRTGDMARLGLLVLRGGAWNGRQIVSAEWLAAMLRPRVEVGQGRMYPQYGYQVWLGERGFCFKGRGGQRIMGNLARDLVIAATAGVSDAEELVLDEQLAAIMDGAQDQPLPENPAAQADLQQAVAQARRPAEPTPPAEPPAIAAKIDGVRFEMGPNLYARQVAYRRTSPAEGVFYVALPAIHRQADLEVRVGLDGVPRFSPGRFGELVAATAHWEGDTLVVNMDELANINRWTWRLTFDESGVSMEVTERTDLPRLSAQGKPAAAK